MNYYGNETSEKVLSIFQNFRMPSTQIDEWDAGGSQKLLHSLNQFVLNGKRIEFAMLGFPFKSTNDRDKVIGKLPDLGEEVAFRNFGQFHKEIAEVYEPGARITVVSDGYIFNDLMGAEESTVATYHEINGDMAKASGVNLLDLRDFFPASKALRTMRETVLESFAPTPEELERRILFDANVAELYRGMIKFMTGDLAIHEFVSNSQLHKAAKKLAREMMIRNEAYSSFMAKELQERTPYIRLSMHPSTNNGTKYSFQLIPSHKAWTSPWHCAIGLENAEYVTIHKKDAEAKGWELEYKNGQPYYYQGPQILM